MTSNDVIVGLRRNVDDLKSMDISMLIDTVDLFKVPNTEFPAIFKIHSTMEMLLSLMRMLPRLMRRILVHEMS